MAQHRRQARHAHGRARSPGATPWPLRAWPRPRALGQCRVSRRRSRPRAALAVHVPASPERCTPNAAATRASAGRHGRHLPRAPSALASSRTPCGTHRVEEICTACPDLGEEQHAFPCACYAMLLHAFFSGTWSRKRTTDDLRQVVLARIGPIE